MDFRRKERKMKKQDRQIVWEKNGISQDGYYKQALLFDLNFPDKVELRFFFPGCDIASAITEYTTVKSAKRGAERFLRRLQEVVK